MPRVGAGPHDARRVDDVVHRDVAVVTDVLHLLAVAGGLLQGLQKLKFESNLETADFVNILQI